MSEVIRSDRIENRDPLCDLLTDCKPVLATPVVVVNKLSDRFILRGFCGKYLRVLVQDF